MLGYACINETLKKNKVSVNRGMIKKTFLERGIDYASELTYFNLLDLNKILEWNLKNNIRFYRMSSDMFPWMSEYNIQDLPNFNLIKAELQSIGKYAKRNGIRLTFHPGPFNKLASDKESIINNTIDELEKHSTIMDLMGLYASPYNKINIHIGGTYGDKQQTLIRFCNNLSRLSNTLLNRLTIENDDVPGQYTVEDLYQPLSQYNIPIVFDYHHAELNPSSKLSRLEEFNLAKKTWPKNVHPVIHYSQSKKLFEDASVKTRAHSSWYYNPIPKEFTNGVDIMLECKEKEKALIKYEKDFKNI